jgi:polyhydroxyalkanoate synthase
VTPDAAAAGGPRSAGATELAKMLSGDALLAPIDRMWNANPLREVIPVDWAEVARALRKVWLRQMADPARAVAAAAELNAKAWTSAVEAWNTTASRWLGLAQAATTTAKPGLGAGDKRFEAPEWHQNPAYRTLKDMYLLASEFLLKQAEADDLDPAERERMTFHLQQFVNATSPTLLLLSNPAACAGRWRPAGPASPTARATSWAT